MKIKLFNDSKKNNDIVIKKENPPSLKTKNTTSLKIVIIILCVLVVVNIILLHLVISKANKISKRSAILAESIISSAVTIDKGYGLKFSVPIVGLDITHLSDENVSQITSSLNAIIPQVIKHKNDLASALSAVSSMIQEGSGISASNFGNFKTYPSSIVSLEEQVKLIMNRYKSLLIFANNVATVIAYPSLESKLNNVDNLKGSLGEMHKVLLDKKAETASLKSTLQDKEKVIAIIKKQLEDISLTKDTLSQTINNNNKQLQQSKDEYNALVQKLDSIQKETEEAAKVAKQKEKTSYPEYFYKLRGKVVEYNSKWGFVIIDLGNNTSLNLTIDGKEKKVNVPVQIDEEMLISRGDKFIAKAKIVNVYNDYSVANLIYPVASEVKLGDTVFFEQPSTSNQ